MLLATVITSRRLLKTQTGRQQLAGRNRSTRTGRNRLTVFHQWRLAGLTQGASCKHTLLLYLSARVLISKLNIFSEVTFFTVSQMSAVAACGKAPQTDVTVDRNIICTGSGSPPIPTGTTTKVASHWRGVSPEFSCLSCGRSSCCSSFDPPNYASFNFT